MTRNIINEGLDYHDLKGQIENKISIDEYAAKMGKDSEIVTMTFITNSKLAANDLVTWLEIGYDYILDASVSDGEIEPGKWLVFAEMNRRTSVPNRIIEILKDLETLTDIKVKDYIIQVNEEEYDADEEVLSQVIEISPHEYRKNKEYAEELNEFRNIANIPSKNIFEDNEYTKYLKSLAGL
jgi:hypothetical protein